MTSDSNSTQNPPRPRGRPTKYDPSLLQQIEKIVSIFGSTDEKLAEFLDVNRDTILEWKNQYPEFSGAIKKGKDVFDSNNVELSLLKRAQGYSRTVERVTKTGEVVACIEEVPPDPVSCFFWLKNRHPERWKDRQEIDHRVQVVPALRIKAK